MLTENWRKPGRSFANGNCVEARWRKSSHSNSGNCLEARQAGTVQVRDSKDPGPVLELSPQAWEAFLASLRARDTPRRWRLLDPPMC